jgi:hypothetical protein
MLDDAGIVLREFNSITEAMLFLGYTYSPGMGGHIGAVCNNKRKKAYGYTWRWA